MNKELSHRSHELKSLGWNQEDLSRYEDLWDYSQRWGLINLEREDRQFLKKNGDRQSLKIRLIKWTESPSIGHSNALAGHMC